MAKRIISCLDIQDGRVVKGVKFVQLRDIGDPVELAKLYEKEGADELVFLDISATVEERETTMEVVQQIAAQLTIPFTVGGGISQVAHMEKLLQAGATKVAISSAAVADPELIAAGAKAFGRERIVVAIDAAFNEAWQDWEVVTRGGTYNTGLRAEQWAKQAAQLGAGEILLTSKDADGTKDGFDLSLTKAIASAVAVPVIASGGAGHASHFYDVLTEGQADAALAASIFHDRQVSIKDIKALLKAKGVIS